MPEQTVTPPRSTVQGEQQGVKSPAPTENDGPKPLPELAATTEIPLILVDVPEGIVTSIVTDVEKRTGADPTEFQILRSQPVVWNNGSLGCPKPGEFYTQALCRWLLGGSKLPGPGIRLSGEWPGVLSSL